MTDQNSSRDSNKLGGRNQELIWVVSPVLLCSSIAALSERISALDPTPSCRPVFICFFASALAGVRALCQE
jgi:hypothetical protein